MRRRRCSGLSTSISPPSDQNACPPRLFGPSWSSRRTRLPARVSSAAAVRPASPAPTTTASAGALRDSDEFLREAHRVLEAVLGDEDVVFDPDAEAAFDVDAR